MAETEFAVVGGGPAGLSAATAAARLGVRVLLVDENERPGGQLFKQIHKFFGSKQHRAGVRGIDIGTKLLAEVEGLGVQVWLNSVAWGLFPGPKLGVIRERKNYSVKAPKVLLATGAMENALAFPGWTLPGVMGAGAIQTLVNVHRVLPGKRVLMVGSGNVGLIVSYQLLQAGAEVVGLVEALPKVGGYGVHASKLRRQGVPIWTRRTVKAAVGHGKVEKAITVALDEKWHEVPGSEQEHAVDVICLALGLTPLAELAWMAGCQFEWVPQLGGQVPVHNGDMESTVKGVYVAGDVSGIEEASTAMEEGKLVGIAVAESLGKISAGDAREKKAAIHAGLEELRAGPFGEGRRAAKEQVHARAV